MPPGCRFWSIRASTFTRNRLSIGLPSACGRCLTAESTSSSPMRLYTRPLEASHLLKQDMQQSLATSSTAALSAPLIWPWGSWLARYNVADPNTRARNRACFCRHFAYTSGSGSLSDCVGSKARDKLTVEARDVRGLAFEAKVLELLPAIYRFAGALHRP